ncbi:right-handed parallel beta-helix repeat-containing protein [Thiocapsa bogorovii]|uniref:right-handed parallel beta-helix repeat-containing protein n=1 Tax=Thiocapsa bogorovii TaxID=521689 RepID=UPI001E3BF33C|nr:right-handed parallel beta-helix repeat-containing protein [Thiocapsa bogorovii]UHD16233.1 right-handed parallel beta-helix repeat-containing protein [Thiocapsa bogorovii]
MKVSTLSRFSALLLFIVATHALSNDYFVSHSGGNTKAGTEEDPWDYKSIDWGLMGGGDTLYIMGTLRGLSAPFKVGAGGSSPDQRFTIASHPDDSGKLWGGKELSGDADWFASSCGAYYIKYTTPADIYEWTTDPWESIKLTKAGGPPTDGCDLWSAAGLWHYEASLGRLYYKPTSGTPSGKTLTSVVATQYGLEIDGKSYVKIDGLVFSQAILIGMFHSTNYVWINDCRIENYKHYQGGIIVNRSGIAPGLQHGRISNNTISGGLNGIYFLNQFQPDPNIGNPAYWLIDNNTIYDINGSSDSHGIGIQGGHGIIIEYNTIYNSGSGITFWASDGQELYNNTIRYNYVHTLRKGPSKHGNGVEFSPENDVLVEDFYNNDIYGNIVSDCDGAGIRWKSGDSESEIYNNTVYNCSPNYYHLAPSMGHSTIAFKFKNNISVSPNGYSQRYHIRINPASSYGIVEGDIDHNLYFPTDGLLFYTPAGECDFDCWSAYAGLATPDRGTSVLADPDFVSKSPSNWQDFRLSGSSPAIDRGADLGDGLALGWDPRQLSGPRAAVDQDLIGEGWEIGVFVYDRNVDLIETPKSLRVIAK